MKISHSDFQNILLWKLLAHAGHERNVQRPIGRSPAAAIQVVRSEERGRKHWPIPSATRRRCVCAEKGVTRNVSVICESYDVALCCDRRCFVDYHNKADPWNISGCSTGSPCLKLWPQLEIYKKKFKIKKIRFLGNTILYIFRRTAEISLF